MSWEHKILLLKVSRHLKNKKCIYIILSYKTIDYNTVKPPVMATSLQLPFFFWKTVHTFTLVSTFLQWPLSSVPKVNAIVERLNCNRKTYQINFVHSLLLRNKLESHFI